MDGDGIRKLYVDYYIIGETYKKYHQNNLIKIEKKTRVHVRGLTRTISICGKKESRRGHVRLFADQGQSLFSLCDILVSWHLIILIFLIL